MTYQKTVTVGQGQTSDWTKFTTWLAPHLIVYGTFDGASVQIEFSEKNDGTDVLAFPDYVFTEPNYQSIFIHGSRITPDWYFRVVVTGGTISTDIKVQL